MANNGYVTLSRQSGLLDQLSVIATNMANAETTGFRREVTVFSEYVKSVGGQTGSISMTNLRTRFADTSQGVIEPTGGALDVAIEGDGYFQLQTPDGVVLTRAGSFTTNPEGVLVSLSGAPVLDAGGAQIQIPPDATTIKIGADGTISSANGQIGQIGIVTVAEPSRLRPGPGVTMISDQPFIPAAGAKVNQGFLEASNVNVLGELTRMIEVQRAYELGQNMIEKESERTSRALRTLGQPPQ